ncbi:MAG: radical SAM protein [Nitrospira sp.]|nr:radical SAM protein [Nitrospira sp.]
MPKLAITSESKESKITHGNVPVLSAEIFTVPLEAGKFLIYAPLRRAAFVGNTKVVNFLADLSKGIFNSERDPDGKMVEFLRQLQILDAGEETPPITVFNGNPEPIVVTLFLTTACNLRCTYCYASAGDTPTRFMSLEVAKRGIDFVVANALKRKVPYFEIAYHGGGEPTVNWQVLTESLDYAHKKAAEMDLKVRASSATNGVLTDTQIDWILASLNGVSLSFDGLPSVHDKHRPTVSGKGSSERVMHTIRRFDKAGFRYGLRVTVTADQIPLLPDSIEYICINFRPQRIQVEPAYQLGRWQNAPSSETEEFIAAFRAAQQRAMKYSHEIYYSAARLGTLTNHFCGVTQDNFALSPDGNVSACYEVFSEESPWAKTFFYGQPDKERGSYTFNLPVLNHLRKQAVQHRDYCQGCFAKWTCAGDCYHKSLTVNGEGEFAGSDRCHITRELTKDQILTKITASGGLFWHEPPHARTGAPAAGKEILL